MNDLERESERVRQRIAGRNMARELFGLIDGDTASEVYMRSLVSEFEALSGLNVRIANPELPPPEPIARQCV